MSVQRRTLLTGGSHRLPPGAVRPHGWLATQLDRQHHGRFQEISHFLRFDDCGWVRPDRPGWEELPYWLKGFGDLGYVTGDPRVLADTERWVEAVIATRAADGYFGPSARRGSLFGHLARASRPAAWSRPGAPPASPGTSTPPTRC